MFDGVLPYLAVVCDLMTSPVTKALAAANAERKQVTDSDITAGHKLLRGRLQSLSSRR